MLAISLTLSLSLYWLSRFLPHGDNAAHRIKGNITPIVLLLCYAMSGIQANCCHQDGNLELVDDIINGKQGHLKVAIDSIDPCG